MGYRKLPLHDLLPKHGMRYRAGRSILRSPRFDVQIYRAWSKKAGSTKIFKDLSKGSRVVDLVLANMIKVARKPSISKHLKSGLAGDGFYSFATAIKKETTWARKLRLGVFMELLYQLIHAHKMSALNEHGDKDQATEYSFTVKEISAFLAEHQQDWSMAAQERENYLLTEAHVFRQEKQSPLQEHFDDALCNAAAQETTSNGPDAMEFDG
ncbi:hypothetical protein PG994_005700 [Apiospora phragmitis]|uniref:Uncharacterized protein n=1 Tax=Apiospora phragmitis TaxID=2905665 RepID=A0ABR1VCZ2_9PEZI